MKNPFKIGDRIVYTTFNGKDHEGTVLYVGEYSLQVKFDDGAINCLSQKICHRLVKKEKPKREPMVIYIGKFKEGMMGKDWYTDVDNLPSYLDVVKFIEVIEE